MSSKKLFARVLVLLLILSGTACIPRQIKPVASIDPTPLLEAVGTRRAALENGLSGSLELAFTGKKRFSGKIYIVAYPDGRFRLEVPGPFGGTHLVMASNSAGILAFYPGQGRAYRSAADADSLNPHIPFPLPVEPIRVPALIMGIPDPEAVISNAQAHLMNSGERQLKIEVADAGLQYTYLFRKGPGNRLSKITIKGDDIRVLVHTLQNSDHLLRDFSITLSEGTLTGEWDNVEPFKGDDSFLDIHLPDTVPVTDLELSP